MGTRGRTRTDGDSVTLSVAAERLDMNYGTLRNYAAKKDRYPDFPEPIEHNAAGHGKRWSYSDVAAFLSRRGGRGVARDPDSDRRRDGRKMTTEPIKKAVQRVCACGCGTVLKTGEKVFGVKTQPGRYIREECGLRIKAEAKASAS